MPKPRRRFGGRKKHEDPPGLEMILCFGAELTPGTAPPHVPDEAVAARWPSTLTRDYIDFPTSGCACDSFGVVMRWLLGRELPISTGEAALVESQYLALSSSEAAYSGLETAEGAGALDLSPHFMRELARYFELAATWHSRRGRRDLAELYKQRARACLAAIPIET